MGLESSTGRRGPGTGQTREGESGQQFAAQRKTIKAPPQVLGGPATQLALCTYICSTAWPSPTMGGRRESPGRLPTLETHLPPGYQCSACSLQGGRGGRPGSCSTKINREPVVLVEVGLFSHNKTTLQASGSEVNSKQARYNVFSFHQQLMK